MLKTGEFDCLAQSQADKRMTYGSTIRTSELPAGIMAAFGK